MLIFPKHRKEKEREQLKRSVLKKTRWRCYYCGTKLTFNSVHDFYMDHFIPKSRGGSDNIRNIFPSCVRCNTWKRDYFISDFRKQVNKKLRLNEFQLAHLESIDGKLRHQIIRFFHRTNYKFWFERKRV